MQNSNEVIDKILNFAQIETNVRAVVMNGSRVNPNALKDDFQDYDSRRVFLEDIKSLENLKPFLDPQ